MLYIQINSNNATAGGVVVNGVTINGAQFSSTDVGNAVLPAGTIFTVISNISATDTSGAFSNLPEGGTITIGINTFQADYGGGDGNDLTLTAIP